MALPNYEKNINKVITAYRPEDYTIQESSKYEQIPLNSKILSGESFTLTSDGKIKIGKNISKILVSGKITLPSTGVTTGGKNFVIRKNGSVINRGMYNQGSVVNSYYVLPPALEEVEENDLIDIAYYGTANNVISGGKVFTNLTVQAVE